MIVYLEVLQMTNFPKDLLNALASNQAVAVVGSGLSVAAGLPSWRELLDLMIAECEQHIVGFNEAEQLRGLLDDGLFAEVADECRMYLQGALYQDFIRRIFHPTSIKRLHQQTSEILTQRGVATFDDFQVTSTF